MCLRPWKQSNKESNSLQSWNSLPVLEAPGNEINRNTEKGKAYPKCPEQWTGRQHATGLPEQDSLGHSPQEPLSSSQSRDTEGHTSALTIQFTAQKLEAKGAGSVARNRVQPDVLCLQRGTEHVNLQAVVVHVPPKHLEGKG